MHWAKQALYIDVQDAETHRMFAEALVGEKDFRAAVAEYEAAVELEPKTAACNPALADACSASRGARIERGKLIKTILADDATFPGAAELLKQVSATKP